ncbi:class I SAM-dependent methyltransferase [Amycolatopsis minnesotensis]|uniref:class I SAM-dependent methyltransferase n=1 Tax=Amycolatopsis minnesotensis TaxID=337894 RepID=UPI0031DD23AA
MSSFEWSHNDFYHRLLLGHLPRGCARVLDVGCGAGKFAAALAGRVGRVDAIDRSAVMIEAAEAATPDNVTCVLGDFLQHEFPERSYDAIFSVTAIHHMPLEDVLSRMAALLRPGGVLAAIALPKSDLPRELPVELVAAAGQRVFGLGFAAARALGRGGWYVRDPEHETMPVVLDPPLTTRAVKTTAAGVLPGVRVRRLVFWRYLLTWRKPEV